MCYFLSGHCIVSTEKVAQQIDGKTELNSFLSLMACDMYEGIFSRWFFFLRFWAYCNLWNNQNFVDNTNLLWLRLHEKHCNILIKSRTIWTIWSTSRLQYRAMEFFSHTIYLAHSMHAPFPYSNELTMCSNLAWIQANFSQERINWYNFKIILVFTDHAKSNKDLFWVQLKIMRNKNDVPINSINNLRIQRKKWSFDKISFISFPFSMILYYIARIQRRIKCSNIR